MLWGPRLTAFKTYEKCFPPRSECAHGKLHLNLPVQAAASRSVCLPGQATGMTLCGFLAPLAQFTQTASAQHGSLTSWQDIGLLLRGGSAAPSSTHSVLPRRAGGDLLMGSILQCPKPWAGLGVAAVYKPPVLGGAGASLCSHCGSGAEFWLFVFPWRVV